MDFPKRSNTKNRLRETQKTRRCCGCRLVHIDSASAVSSTHDEKAAQGKTKETGTLSILRRWDKRAERSPSRFGELTQPTQATNLTPTAKSARSPPLISSGSSALDRDEVSGAAASPRLLCYADAFSCVVVAAGAPASMLARFTRVSAAISVGGPRGQLRWRHGHVIQDSCAGSITWSFTWCCGAR